MKPHHAAALEIRLLVELVAKVKSLNISSALEWGKTMDLKCPCGEVILQPTPVIPSLKDRQRALLKSRIKSHLRFKHGLSEHTIRIVLNQSFNLRLGHPHRGTMFGKKAIPSLLRNLIEALIPNSQCARGELFRAMAEKFVVGYAALPLVGTPEQVVDHIAEMASSGIDDLTLR